MNLRAMACAIAGHPIPRTHDVVVSSEYLDAECRRCRQPIHWFNGRWW